MRVNAPEAAKSVFRHTCPAEIRQFDLLRRADHDVLDLPLAVEQDADLPPCLVRKLGHLPGKLRRHDLILSHTPGAELLDTPKLILF